ncbi:Uncharacterised protein [Enterobacter hormaechei]|uniref:structural cement protein Gp24 n=1 Tax=Enterobacter hormaechei TaxID=158836 RepID=UPI000797E69C|nr:hypothetical protein [Enterobacter hormaechei]SAH61367.1 Uncharacterised protein [Enterobacter hormaechei]
MSFQNSIPRNYVKGYIGEMIQHNRDYPYLVKPGRFNNFQTSAPISLAFGIASEQEVGAPLKSPINDMFGFAAKVEAVEPGGTAYYGILINPKHYALSGDGENILAPTYRPADGSIEGEFVEWCAGVIVGLFNETAADKTVLAGSQLAYRIIGDTTSPNIPFGGLISVAPGAAAPAGFKIIPDSCVNTHGVTISTGGYEAVEVSLIWDINK